MKYQRHSGAKPFLDLAADLLIAPGEEETRRDAKWEELGCFSLLLQQELHRDAATQTRKDADTESRQLATPSHRNRLPTSFTSQTNLWSYVLAFYVEGCPELLFASGVRLPSSSHSGPDQSSLLLKSCEHPSLPVPIPIC